MTRFYFSSTYGAVLEFWWCWRFLDSFFRNSLINYLRDNSRDFVKYVCCFRFHKSTYLNIHLIFHLNCICKPSKRVWLLCNDWNYNSYLKYYYEIFVDHIISINKRYCSLVLFALKYKTPFINKPTTVSWFSCLQKSW